MIEMQEKIDEHLRKEGSGRPGASWLQEKGLFSACVARLEASVDEKFSTLLPEFLEDNIHAAKCENKLYNIRKNFNNRAITFLWYDSSLLFTIVILALI